MIFTLPEIYRTVETAKELARHECRIVTVKTSKGDTIPNGAIDFSELMSTKGNILVDCPLTVIQFQRKKYFSIHTDVDFSSLDKRPTDVDDVFVLPYSSGTTGLPKVS